MMGRFQATKCEGEKGTINVIPVYVRERESKGMVVIDNLCLTSLNSRASREGRNVYAVPRRHLLRSFGSWLILGLLELLRQMVDVLF
jgi:hypothetical protein